jgi:hypothetical protein
MDFLRIAAARGKNYDVRWAGTVLGFVRLLATSGKLPNRLLHGYIRCEKRSKWKKVNNAQKNFEDDEIIPADGTQGFKTVGQFLNFVGTVDVWWESLKAPSIFDTPVSGSEGEGEEEDVASGDLD